MYLEGDVPGDVYLLKLITINSFEGFFSLNKHPLLLDRHKIEFKFKIMNFKESWSRETSSGSCSSSP